MTWSTPAVIDLIVESADPYDFEAFVEEYEQKYGTSWCEDCRTGVKADSTPASKCFDCQYDRLRRAVSVWRWKGDNYIGEYADSTPSWGIPDRPEFVRPEFVGWIANTEYNQDCPIETRISDELVDYFRSLPGFTPWTA